MGIESRIAGHAVNDLSNPLAGLTAWSNVENVAIDDTNYTANVSLSTVDVEDPDTSRVLLTQLHRFNLPDNISSIDVIEITWNIKSQSDTTRYFTALYSDGYGTTQSRTYNGSQTNITLTQIGTPAELGFPSLTVNEIDNTFFGAGLVAYDSSGVSPTIEVNSVSIEVTFSGTKLTYNESNDYFFALGGGITGGIVYAKPYIIDFPGELDGGILTNGSHTVGGSQTMVGTGGVLFSANTEVNPYFEFGSGGSVVGGIGFQTFEEIGSGGLLANGKSPNGTHDYGSGGVLVRGLGDLKIDFVTATGGALISGYAPARPYFVDFPGELEGGVKIGSRAKTQYDEITTGGVTIPSIPAHFFSFDPLYGSNGVLIGGSAEVNPYFETVSGGVKVDGIAQSEVIWIGLDPFSLYQGSALVDGTVDETVIITEFPSGGLLANGNAPEYNFIEDISGGIKISGSAIAGIEPPSTVGTLIGGSATDTVSANHTSEGGGVVLKGTYLFNYQVTPTGGVTIEEITVVPSISFTYVSSGEEVTVESIYSTADYALHLTHITTGEELVVNSSTGLSELTVHYNAIGGLEIDGIASVLVGYNYNVNVGSGLIIGSVSDTGIPEVFRAIRKPKGSVGRSLASDNIFKTELESLVITTIPKNTACAQLSTTDITLNKCQGAFVPPQLVNRQKAHLPTGKNEAKNRSSQFAEIV